MRGQRDGSGILGDLAAGDGCFRDLSADLDGRRALLLEPLRSIAQDKFEELTAILPQLGGALNRKLNLSITTGDYRLENDPRFLARVDAARSSLRAGRGVKLEDVGG